MELDWNLILQFVGMVGSVGAMIFASTWKLAGKINTIEAKLDMHMSSDNKNFADIENDLNIIAPRTVPLRTRSR